MVGDDAVRHALDARVGHAGELGHAPDGGLEELGGVGVLRAGHDRGEALEAQAGIDVLLRQRLERAPLATVELGEHQVPDLHEAVARTGVGPGLVLGAELGPAIVEHLGAGPAGAVRALADGVGGPEVLVLAPPGDARRGHADVPGPDLEGLVVVLVDGDVEALGLEPEPGRVGHELPRPGRRLLLEVVAEGEVAHHLEEGVVSQGPPDVLDVVDPQALLRRGHPVVDALHAGELGCGAEEVGLELHHAGAGEHQGGVVGLERGRGVREMPLAFEEAQVFRPQLVDALDAVCHVGASRSH